MKIKKLLNFNINFIIKIVLLFGFAGFFLITIISGTISMYVHPRIIPYLIFTSAVMIVMAFLYLGELFKHNSKAKSWPLLFFIIPLMMAFTLPAQSFDLNTTAVGNLQLSDKGVFVNGNSNQNTEISAENNLGQVEDTPSDSSDIELQDGVIIMDSNNFYYCLNEIYENMEGYEGMSIEVIGFVFKDCEGLSANEFVPARLLMVCCAADMIPIGFLCRYDKASDLETDSWVKVTGTLGSTEFDGDVIPYINAINVEKTEQPNDNYIYPY